MKRKGKSAGVASVATVHDPKPEGSEPAVVVFGMSEQGLAQAAWFTATDAELAVKAAGLMKLRAAKTDTDEHRELARQLRQGQVYGSERTFAPVVNESLYKKLFELCGQAPVEDLALPRPASFDEVQAGSLVLALDEGPDDGWYEAVVVAVQDDLLQLRWRYAAREPSFIRTRQQIGLLSPEAPAEAIAA